MLKAVDFFCGAGGVTCGFKKAGINVLGGIDIDESCRKTYTENNSAEFIQTDISTFPKESLALTLKIKRNQDDLVFIGCSPCQYYSNINTDKTKSSNTRYLLADFQEFVDYYKPGYVFIENVPGIDKKKDSPLGIFKEFLTKNNYTFSEGVVNAKYYGVPQNRRRYILIASRLVKGLKLPPEDREHVKTVEQTIGDYKVFKPIKAGYKDTTDFIHSAALLSDKNLKRITLLTENGMDRRVWKDNQELQLDCYKEHEGHYDVYGRMYWNKPSPAITTKFISLSNGRYGHPEQNRAISLREGAALQSFPLDYNFYSSSQSAIAKMIGNAVPPELARRVAEYLKSIHTEK